jgi:hypothetical protein
MESPFRSEAAAFRFLLITLGAFALIVVAASISTGLGVVAWIALSLAAVWAYLRQRGPAPDVEHVEHIGALDERRVLVVANETIGSEELLSAMSTRALLDKTSFLVVCPARTRRSGRGHRTRTGRAAAQERLDEMLSGRFGRDDARHGRGQRPAGGDRGRRADVPAGRDRDLVQPPEARSGTSRASSSRLAHGSTCRWTASRGRREARLPGRPDGLPYFRRPRRTADASTCAASADAESGHPPCVRDAIGHELLRRLRGVEVRPRRAARAGVGERVAAAAARREDRLAVRRLLGRLAGACNRPDVRGNVLDCSVLVLDAERVALDVVAAGSV